MLNKYIYLLNIISWTSLVIPCIRVCTCISRPIYIHTCQGSDTVHPRDLSTLFKVCIDKDQILIQLATVMLYSLLFFNFFFWTNIFNVLMYSTQIKFYTHEHIYRRHIYRRLKMKSLNSSELRHCTNYHAWNKNCKTLTFCISILSSPRTLELSIALSDWMNFTRSLNFLQTKLDITPN